MSAGNVTAFRTATPQEIDDAIEYIEAAWGTGHRFYRSLCTLRAEVAALRRQVEERRVEVPEPTDEELAAVVYDVGGDSQNDFERALVLNGVYWARSHLSHSATSADVVTVPDRAEWLTIEELVYSIRSVLPIDSAKAVEVARAIEKSSKVKAALRSGEAAAPTTEEKETGNG